MVNNINSPFFITEQAVNDYKSFYCNVPAETTGWVDSADIEARAGADRAPPHHLVFSLTERRSVLIHFPLHAPPQGTIPEELRGTLLRNGPGLCQARACS